MRKLIMIVTLAISWLAVSATAGIPTPQCDPNCPVNVR